MLLAQLRLWVYSQKIHRPHEAANQLIPDSVPHPAQILDHLDYSARVLQELFVDCLAKPALTFNVFGFVPVVQI